MSEETKQKKWKNEKIRKKSQKLHVTKKNERIESRAVWRKQKSTTKITTTTPAKQQAEL